MPKFQLMQKLVDNINLVSREILTGLSAVSYTHLDVYKRQNQIHNLWELLLAMKKADPESVFMEVSAGKLVIEDEK